MQNGTCRQEWSSQFLRSESVLQALEIIQNNKALKEKATQNLAGFSSPRKYFARDKLFESLGYDCPMSQYSTNSEEELATKEVRIKIARCKFLKPNRENSFSRFSW